MTNDENECEDNLRGHYGASTQTQQGFGVKKTEEKFRIVARAIYESEEHEEHTLNIITDELTIGNLISVAQNDFRNRPEAKQLKITITKEN